MRRLIFLTLVTVLTVALAGCETTAPNTNNARNNTNNNTNTNNATLVNNNQTNANTGATNTNRWSNTNVSREDYDKSKADYEKEKGTSTIGSGANDSYLWFKTRAALLATSDLRESTVNVDVVDGVISLKGTVATDAQKKKAEEVANGIDGKKSVKNELKVAPKDSMMNTSTTDSDTKTKTNSNVKK